MKKVLLGMSGGVDSSVSALLLQERGYEVVGATMVLWNSKDTDPGCGSLTTVKEAKDLCDKLGIEHYVLDFTKEFKEHVIDNFIESYVRAITPNPCIECNRFLKFNLLYEKAKELGCEYIATGHYAKTEYSEKYNQYVIKQSNSEKKDQSYVLYTVQPELIDKIIFPLGEFENKEKIRKIAEEHGMASARKPDSQEICFIPDNNYARFLLENLKEKPKPGNIVDMNGNILGKHTGLINYTVGQRKGMGISSKTPLYVIKLDKENNNVIVGQEQDTYRKELQAYDLNMQIKDIPQDMEITAKIRYSAKPANAVLHIENNIAKVTFTEPQKHITPGQSVVFYDGDIIIGGGKII